MAGRTRIVIADDHPMVRQALAEAARKGVAEPEIVEAQSLAEALAVIAAPAADLLMLDLRMPGMDGLAGLARIRAEHPAIPVIVVSALDDAATQRNVAALGAAGFLSKSEPLAVIARAIATVLEGELWLAEPGPADGPRPAEVSRLTPQQLRVLALLAEGRLNKQIAHEMSITEATVKAHVTAILHKLGVRTRVQAVIAARQLGLSAGAA
jgi:DNA-binding NarL/FixJ family response regulator